MKPRLATKPLPPRHPIPAGRAMIETELKITLDAAAMARLRAAPGARARCAWRRADARRWSRSTTTPPTTRSAAAGVSLRLRRVGRALGADGEAARRGHRRRAASSRNRETECPAPGGRLVLDGPDPDGALAAVGARPPAARRCRRSSRPACGGVTERLRGAGRRRGRARARRGEIRAGEARAPIREAELELKAGRGRRGLRGRAACCSPAGPVRFADRQQVGARLPAGRHRRRRAPSRPAPGRRRSRLDARRRRSRPWPATSSATAWRRSPTTWRWSPDSDAIEGPHQLRVGLRRLRTAFTIFAPSPRRRGAGAAVGRRRAGSARSSAGCATPTC